MPNYTLSNTESSYLAAWENMKIHPNILPEARSVANKIISYKDRYEPLEKATGVPWYFIGLLHLRESNFDFDTHLHNGDPLNENGRFKRTVHVPKNRPIAPPKNGKSYTFEESAIDALVYEFGKIKQWSIGQIAFLLETYNGFGYRDKGLPSPYLWAGSNQYTRGKYIRDHVFDPNVVDSQLGAMVVLKCVLDQDVGIKFEVEQQEESIKAPISPAADVAKPTSKELRKVSRKFNLVEWMQQFFAWLTTGTIVVKGLDAASIADAKSLIDTMKTFINDYGVYALMGLLIAGFVATQLLKHWMKKDVEEGRSTPSGEIK